MSDDWQEPHQPRKRAVPSPVKDSDRSQPTTPFYFSVDGAFFFFKHLKKCLLIFVWAGCLLLCVGVSLVVASRGYSLVSVWRLLFVVASLFCKAQAVGSSNCGAWP